MLVNWKIKYCTETPLDRQPPDYYVYGDKYWFYRYFNSKPDVDVLDISSISLVEKIEKNVLRFYILQALRAIPKLKNYDLVVSHGMQSAIVLSLWRRYFTSRTKHVVFDIGSFNSAAEKGIALKLMQYASKSIDYVIYHTSSQINYYEKYFSWIIKKSMFIRFGTDSDYFKSINLMKSDDINKYIICVGYSKRDWETVIAAYKTLNTNIRLRLVGCMAEKYKNIPGVDQIPFVSIRELMNQIHNALFCVLPLKSYNYSYGQMTLMQQMALEKAVIVTRVQSVIDYVQNDETVILCEPCNIEDLRNKMTYLLANQEGLINISRKAKEFISTKCNEKIMAVDLENIFIKLSTNS